MKTGKLIVKLIDINSKYIDYEENHENHTEHSEKNPYFN